MDVVVEVKQSVPVTKQFNRDITSAGIVLVMHHAHYLILTSVY